jgi:NAD(P)-dependent dehydrogenase (short-subunit alcohol dehydrogenase family)
MLTACLDQELKPKGVRVFAVHPGRLKTAAAAPDADTEPLKAALLERAFELGVKLGTGG